MDVIAASYMDKAQYYHKSESDATGAECDAAVARIRRQLSSRRKMVNGKIIHSKLSLSTVEKRRRI